jgi:hypothetical protein
MSDAMDAAIERAEALISSVSVGEVNFKLVLATTRLSDSVAVLERTVMTLTDSVSQLTTDINGGKGVRVEMQDIRRDIRDTDKKIADVSGRIESGMTVVWRVLWFLCLVGIITVVTEIRSFAPILLGGGK